VVEADAVIPDGVENLLCHTAGRAKAAVENNEIKIRKGRQFTSSEPAHGDEGYVLGGNSAGGGNVADPFVSSP
jgi:hypothetical protein